MAAPIARGVLAIPLFPLRPLPIGSILMAATVLESSDGHAHRGWLLLRSRPLRRNVETGGEHGLPLPIVPSGGFRSDGAVTHLQARRVSLRERCPGVVPVVRGRAADVLPGVRHFADVRDREVAERDRRHDVLAGLPRRVSADAPFVDQSRCRLDADLRRPARLPAVAPVRRLKQSSKHRLRSSTAFSLSVGAKAEWRQPRCCRQCTTRCASRHQVGRRRRRCGHPMAAPIAWTVVAPWARFRSARVTQQLEVEEVGFPSRGPPYKPIAVGASSSLVQALTKGGGGRQISHFSHFGLACAATTVASASLASSISGRSSGRPCRACRASCASLPDARSSDRGLVLQLACEGGRVAVWRVRRR